MPGDDTGENARAVRMFGRILHLKDLVSGKILQNKIGEGNWPVTSGNYIVGDSSATIAVCTLTSPELMEPLSKVPGVAIIGRLVTVNLGIEKVILNTISNENIRYLLVCGKESPVFHPAQALQCLFKNGIDDEQRIEGAEGHFPVLNNMQPQQVERFRQQVQLVNHTGELSEKKLCNTIAELKGQNKSPFVEKGPVNTNASDVSKKSSFKKIRPGGKRGTPAYDPEGFFVITIDKTNSEIVLQHYHSDHTPAHEMRGRRADAMIRALVRAGLVSQLSHAGYLGVELAKAETALRLNLSYEQDHPLKK